MTNLFASNVVEMHRADMFMMASGYEGPLPNGDGYAGLDISHRGGQPGFVRLEGSGTLKWPDYLGNLTFTTLGEPAGPLLFGGLIVRCKAVLLFRDSNIDRYWRICTCVQPVSLIWS